MKLVFSKKETGNGTHRVIAIPTTKKEKEFFNTIKDMDGNYRPWVYDALFKFDNKIVDNPFVDEYDENGSLVSDNSGAYMQLVDDLKVDGMTWSKSINEDDYFKYLIKPSNFCILSFYYFYYNKFGKMRRIKHLYKRMIELERGQTSIHFKE